MRYLFILLFPVFAFTSFDDYYIQSFADHFQRGDFTESLEILERWETLQPPHGNRILGMKAAVYLAQGDLEKSKILMDECVKHFESNEISDPLLLGIITMYYKSLENTSENFLMPIGLFQLCKQGQPKGVKLKYWFGVGQIVVGVLAVPFSAGTSTSLILSGTAMVVDAASDAINNKENWERNLNERQRINPDIQNNSFSIDPFCASTKLLLV